MSAQPQRSFTIRSADSNDGEGILACLASAFAPYRNSYTPAAFTDTVLDAEMVQHRLREMCAFVAVSKGEVVGTIACAASGDEGHLRGMAVMPDWQGQGVASGFAQGCRSGDPKSTLQARHTRHHRTLDTRGALLRGPWVHPIWSGFRFFQDAVA
jgi:GNAT superfamily N-acetyltransferase